MKVHVLSTGVTLELNVQTPEHALVCAYSITRRDAAAGDPNSPRYARLVRAIKKVDRWMTLEDLRVAVV